MAATRELRHSKSKPPCKRSSAVDINAQIALNVPKENLSYSKLCTWREKNPTTALTPPPGSLQHPQTRRARGGAGTSLPRGVTLSNKLGKGKEAEGSLFFFPHFLSPLIKSSSSQHVSLFLWFLLPSPRLLLRREVSGCGGVQLPSRLRPPLSKHLYVF